MKNYFKNYYRQRLTNKILNENYDGLREQIKENVLKVHSNIMKGYSPAGYEYGFIDPESQTSYIQLFTNFIKEHTHVQNITWKDANFIHNSIINETLSQDLLEAYGQDYISNFIDFMNTPSIQIVFDNIELIPKPSGDVISEGDINDPHDPKNFGINFSRLKPGQFVSHGDIFDEKDLIYRAITGLHWARTNNRDIPEYTEKVRRLGFDPDKIKTPENWKLGPTELGDFNFDNMEQFRLKTE